MTFKIVTNKTPEDVFGLLVRSINESEFTIISMDKDLGFISASRAGPLLAPKDIQINCNVQESADGMVVDVKSTFTGDIVAYGTTKGAIVAMFKSFVQYVPDAKLSIDGKPFKP